MGKLILNFCLLTTFCFCTTTLAAKVGSIDMDGETASTSSTLPSKYNEGSGDLVLTSAAVLLQLVLHIVFKSPDSNSLTSEPPLPPVSSTISNDHNREGARNRRLQSISSDVYWTGYGLQSKQSGKCMDIYQGSTASGIKPAIWTCNDQLNQKFKFRFQNEQAPETEDQPSLSDNFQIVAQNSGKCLELLEGATGNNADVYQNDCLNDPDLSPDNQQLWFMEREEKTDLGTGYFSLRSAEDIDMCLTVFEGKVEDGQIINIYSCSESNNQLWKFY